MSLQASPGMTVSKTLRNQHRAVDMLKGVHPHVNMPVTNCYTVEGHHSPASHQSAVRVNLHWLPIAG
jgi:hypothetical protein